MNDELLSDLEIFFMALADKTRLRLLNLMREGEVCVYFFTEVLGDSQPKISRHLAYLRNAGLVETRRDGKWINYRLIRPQNEYTAQILEDTLDSFLSNEEMREDYKKLSVLRDALETSTTAYQPPKSNIFVEANMRSSSQEIETFLL